MNIQLPRQYVPETPTAHQWAFLALPHREALYGGAAGGGKSSALLMAALQYVHEPLYSALILRKTFQELDLPGALLDRAHQWLGSTDAIFQPSKKRWVFPSGAKLTFGYLEHERDVARYLGSEYHFIGWDELTTQSKDHYTRVNARVRRTAATAHIPLRIRSATNPGGVGHEWVKARFIDEPRRWPFIPAKITDNPHLDQKAQIEGLQELDPITRAQMLHGDWNVRPTGGMFDGNQFKIVQKLPAHIDQIVRYWDMAATQGGGAYTVGVKIGKISSTRNQTDISFSSGGYIVLDVQRGQWDPGTRNRVIMQTAEKDGKETAIRFEQEPGGSGKEVADHLIQLLAAYPISADRVTGSKTLRAQPWANAVSRGEVFMSDAPWNFDFITEHAAFPNGKYKDQVDAAGGAFATLAKTNFFMDII
jgi:predicted phage terminase large subunit-like protein